jgi:hypothetical protein
VFEGTPTTVATLDDPQVIAPGFHIWTRSRIGWFETADHLDRHDHFRPDTARLNDIVVAGASARSIQSSRRE